MIESVKTISNPLTIIAIFAALAEIAGTVALKIVTPELQVTFIWFVMIFPVILVLLFFITLNFNPKVLYAPSDFRNEENFLNVLSGVSRVSDNLEDVNRQLDLAKNKLISDAVEQIGIASENERSRLAQLINNSFSSIQDRVETTRESAQGVVNSVPKLLSPLQFKVLKSLQESATGVTTGDVAKACNLSDSKARQILQLLRTVGYVDKVANTYRITRRGEDALSE